MMKQKRYEIWINFVITKMNQAKNEKENIE